MGNSAVQMPTGFTQALGRKREGYHEIQILLGSAKCEGMGLDPNLSSRSSSPNADKFSSRLYRDKAVALPDFLIFFFKRSRNLDFFL